MSLLTEFTKRERMVLDYIIEYPQLTLEEVGKQLNITGRTVRTHVGNMLYKSGCNSLRALVVVAIKEGYDVTGVVHVALHDGKLHITAIEPVDVSFAVWRLAKGHPVFIRQKHVAQIRRVLSEKGTRNVSIRIEFRNGLG